MHTLFPRPGSGVDFLLLTCKMSFSGCSLITVTGLKIKSHAEFAVAVGNTLKYSSRNISIIVIMNFIKGIKVLKSFFK